MSQKAPVRQRTVVTTSRVGPAHEEGYGHALEPLLAATEKRLGQFLVQIIRDRALAEDILQDTLLAAFEQRAELVHVRNPEACSSASPEIARSTRFVPPAVRGRPSSG